MLPDEELLRRYAEKGEQGAFTELIQRHANFAFRTALRSLGGDAHAAQDATQRVFTDLARKASALRHHRNLAGWIHLSVRYVATDAVRAEQRRRLREERGGAELTQPAELPWARLEPLIDELLMQLPARDREALMLHFFEGRSFPELGALLTMSADAARMRVNRALERLRTGLRERGLISSAAVLGEALLTQSAQAAGLPVASELAAHALGQAAQLGPVGIGSLSAKGIHAIRALPLSGWVAAGVVFVGGMVFYRQGTHRDPPPPPPPPVPAVAVHLTAEAPEEELKPAPGESIPPSPADRSTAVAYTAVETKFTDLTEQEKRILKILWSREVEFGRTPGLRWVVIVPPDKPNFPQMIAARRALRLNGWVGVNRQGSVFLTEAGLAYCIEQRSAIDAFPMPNTRPAKEPGGAADR